MGVSWLLFLVRQHWRKNHIKTDTGIGAPSFDQAVEKLSERAWSVNHLAQIALFAAPMAVTSSGQ
jgi:hypothetical protein